MPDINMRKIELNRIILKDWKSLNVDVTFNKGMTKISGRNGIGKSSLQSAWNWLLTSYTNAVSPKNHELFDNRTELSENTPIASVKAYLTIDGMEYTLERTAQAKFTRKRGSNVYEKAAADVYVTKIDEIECSANEFSKWIEANICDSDILVYLLDGSFFSTLSVDDKQRARKTLERLVGEITDDDMRGDYHTIIPEMKKYGIDGLRERVKNLIKPLKNGISELDTTIRNKEQECASINKDDFSNISAEVQDIKKQFDEIDEELVKLNSSTKPIADKRAEIVQKIHEKTVLLGDLGISHDTERKFKIANLLGQISQVDKTNRLIKEANEVATSDYEYNSRSLEAEMRSYRALEWQREFLIGKRDEVKTKVFDGDKCAYCGQELPLDMLEDAKRKFNETKQKELDSIVAQGKSVKEKLEISKQRIEELTKIKDAGVKVQPYESKEDLEKELERLKAESIPFEETEEYKSLTKEIDELRASIPDIPENNIERLIEKRKALLETLEELNRKYAFINRVSELETEISGLKKRKFDTGCRIAELEGALDKIDEYLNERANIVAERINSRLDGCLIDMYRTQRDGTRVEDCVIKSKDGVNFATLNNSARILINIQLQHLFMSHFGVELPTFIDEASVFDTAHRPVLSGQSIMLFASDDMALKVE